MGVAVEAVRHPYVPRTEIDRFDRADERVHPAEELAQGVDDRAELEVAGGHLVEHGREEEEVVARDERDLEGLPPREHLLQLEGGVDAAEPTTQDEDTSGGGHWLGVRSCSEVGHRHL